MVKKVLEPFIYPIDPKVHLVCGVDEAGRGPLVGNVVAACEKSYQKKSVMLWLCRLKKMLWLTE